jgi:hypothetical protein
MDAASRAEGCKIFVVICFRFERVYGALDAEYASEARDVVARKKRV